MPLDPSISLQAGQGVTPLTSPIAMASQYQGLSNAMAQNRLINANVDSTQQATSTSKQAQAQSAQMAQSQGLSELAALPPQYRTQGAAMQLSASNLARGIITPEEHDASVKAIQATGSQQDLDNLIHAASLHQLLGPQKMAAMFGTNGDQTNGQYTYPGTKTDPIQRAFSPGLPPFVRGGSDVRQMLTPGEKAGQIQIIGADNQPGTTSLGTRMDDYGNAKGGSSSIPIGYQPPGTPPQAPQPAGFTPTQPTPDFTANREAYQAAQTELPKAQLRIQNLQEAQNALALTNSGPGEGYVQKVRAFLQARGVRDIFDGQSDAATNFAMANKYLLKYAASAAGSTDAGRAIEIDSNANTGQPKPATLAIIRNTIGQERMQMAATMTHSNTNGTGFLAHRAGYTGSYDPRAFSADMYSPQDLQQIQQTLKTPADQAKFYNGLVEAKRLGMISVPGAGQ